jgi:hypothetical protein
MAYTTINKPSEYFNTHLYSGNETTNNQSVGLTPDLVWIKCRNVGSPTQHYIVDKVRGNEKYISSNATTAEQTESGNFELVSGGFNLDGGNGWTNVIGRNYVAWNWLANGAGVSNTDGSITSTVSANTTSGFSIVTYTGTGANATVGHGLGVAPKMIIFKNRNTSTDWDVYHGSLANTERIHLNTTGAKNTAAHAFNSTSPTISVFSVGTADNTNKSSSPMIAYCFAEKKGFSKFGSYTGNNNADGAFIYTGFKPAWVLFKRSSATENWSLYDNKRLGYNPQSYGLRPNIDSAESEYATTASVDFVSNGFKIREAGTNINNGTYIYLAFAEEPLVGTNNIPATAR